MYVINTDDLDSTSLSLQGSSVHAQLQQVTRTIDSKSQKVSSYVFNSYSYLAGEEFNLVLHSSVECQVKF